MLKPPKELLDPEPRILRQFGLAAAVVLVVWATFGAAMALTRVTALGLALAAVALAAIRPGLLAAPFRLLTRLTWPIGQLVSFVVLVLIWYLVLTPTAVLVRALRGDRMHFRLDRGRSSYWTERPKDGPTLDSRFRQF